MEKEATINTTETQRINSNEELQASKLETLKEIDKLLDLYSLPRTNQEDTQNLNRFITRDETEAMRLK